jgi:hypothetical protein
MDEQPRISLELQRRIEQRWIARFTREQQLTDRRLESAGRSGRHRPPSGRTTHYQRNTWLPDRAA